MKCNVAIWDRILRFIMGFLLVTYAVAGGPSWGYFGIYFFITSAWGLCPAYGFFGINTLKEPDRVFPSSSGEGEEEERGL